MSEGVERVYLSMFISQLSKLTLLFLALSTQLFPVFRSIDRFILRNQLAAQILHFALVLLNKRVLFVVNGSSFGFGDNHLCVSRKLESRDAFGSLKRIRRDCADYCDPSVATERRLQQACEF